MRIMHVVNDHRNLGNGIVNVAIDLACLQARAGHQVFIASAGGDFESLLLEHNVTCVPFKQQRTIWGMFRAALGFRQIINTVKPDVVHGHMMTGVVLARALRFGNRFRLVSSVHNEFQRSATVMGIADVVIAVSEAVSVSMRRRGIPKRKLHVVRNGTIGSPRTAGHTAAVDLAHPAIVSVAGLYERKGIADLLSAFEITAHRFPEAQLYIVGDGPQRKHFESLASESRWRSRIHFEGFKTNVKSYFQEADIFVLASHADPFPLVLAEAREAGCAIVATNIDGIPEALEHGRCGILVPPHNSSALATALTSLLEDRAVLSSWKAKSASNLAWLSAERVAAETMTVYETPSR